MTSAATYDEGVVKFAVDHRREPLDARRYGELAAALAGWRRVMAMTGVVGQEAARYGGAGFGNVSARVGAPASPLGRRAMLVSCTQTGGQGEVGLDDFCIVERYDIAGNRVESRGLCQPSSEAMTHGAIYDLGPHIRAVLHGHAPILWSRARELRVPCTAPGVAYGTQEMAREMARLYRSSGLPEQQILAMTGHQDGVIAFGRSVDEAGQVLVTYLARALRPA
jgi:ribulose-5-phosphate 4-epimerase/fuculose-1-phosphate aldolase